MFLPNDWREALFKKGSKSASQNYRPVSLTSVICKQMESIIKDEIIEHLNIFKLINGSQHGSTKGRSCLANLLEFFEKVVDTIDKGKPFDCIYLDFAKVFDKVPHFRLIKKLKAHRVDGNVEKCIFPWLTGRRQRVIINGVSSSWGDVISGVPQDSVLGPLLFFIYINHIDTDLFSKICKFSDDTKIGRAVATENEVQLLRHDLKNLAKWATDWQMLFNVEKCVVMHIGTNNKLYSYSMNNATLKTVDSWCGERVRSYY